MTSKYLVKLAELNPDSLRKAVGAFKNTPQKPFLEETKRTLGKAPEKFKDAFWKAHTNASRASLGK